MLSETKLYNSCFQLGATARIALFVGAGRRFAGGAAPRARCGPRPLPEPRRDPAPRRSEHAVGPGRLAPRALPSRCFRGRHGVHTKKPDPVRPSPGKRRRRSGGAAPRGGERHGCSQRRARPHPGRGAPDPPPHRAPAPLSAPCPAGTPPPSAASSAPSLRLPSRATPARCPRRQRRTKRLGGRLSAGRSAPPPRKPPRQTREGGESQTQ